MPLGSGTTQSSLSVSGAISGATNRRAKLNEWHELGISRLRGVVGESVWSGVWRKNLRHRRRLWNDSAIGQIRAAAGIAVEASQRFFRLQTDWRSGTELPD